MIIKAKGRFSIHKTSSKHDDDQGPLSCSAFSGRISVETVATGRDNARDDDSDTGGRK
jgi:hypothetical protein